MVSGRIRKNERHIRVWNLKKLLRQSLSQIGCFKIILLEVRAKSGTHYRTQPIWDPPFRSRTQNQCGGNRWFRVQRATKSSAEAGLPDPTNPVNEACKRVTHTIPQCAKETLAGKAAVAKAKNAKMDPIYEKLDGLQGDGFAIRLAKARRVTCDDN